MRKAADEYGGGPPRCHMLGDYSAIGTRGSGRVYNLAVSVDIEVVACAGRIMKDSTFAVRTLEI